jgi:hypothetical protein
VNLEEVVSALDAIADYLAVIAKEMQWWHEWTVTETDRADTLAIWRPSPKEGGDG